MKNMNKVTSTIKLLTPDEVAAYLNFHRNSLANWRVQKLGPPYCRFGRHIYYPEKEFKLWLKNSFDGQTKSVKKDIRTEGKPMKKSKKGGKKKGSC